MTHRGVVEVTERITERSAGSLTVEDPLTLLERAVTGRPLDAEEWAGTGRELFAAFRAYVGPADEGASVFGAVPAPALVPTPGPALVSEVAVV